MAFDSEKFKKYDEQLMAQGSVSASNEEASAAVINGGGGGANFKVGDKIRFLIKDDGNLNIRKVTEINGQKLRNPQWTCTAILNDTTYIQFWPSYFNRSNDEYVYKDGMPLFTGNTVGFESPIPVSGSPLSFYTECSKYEFECKEVKRTSTRDMSDPTNIVPRNSYKWSKTAIGSSSSTAKSKGKGK